MTFQIQTPLGTASGERLIAKTRPAAEAPFPPGCCEPVTSYEFPTAASLRRCREWRSYPGAARLPGLHRVAHHEAAHVVLLEWVGVEALEVTAEPNRGLCQFIPPSVQTDCDIRDDSGHASATAAAVFHAGVMGELLFMGEAWTGPIFYPHAKDYLDADDMLVGIFGRHASGAHAFAQQVALHVLAGRWARVREVAAHLIEFGRWSPCDVDGGPPPGERRSYPVPTFHRE